MKTLLTLLSASAILSTAVFAEMPAANQERVEAQHEVQNQFKNMKTDELLEKRGTMSNQQDREQLHNELMKREKSMTKEQKEKFNKRPENRTPKMKNQGQGKGMNQGNAYGQGQGMMQGEGKKMDDGMGKGKGGK